MAVEGGVLAAAAVDAAEAASGTMCGPTGEGLHRCKCAR